MSRVPLPTVAELTQDPTRAEDLSPETARTLLLQLAPLQEALRLRALRPPGGPNGEAGGPTEAGRYLTIPEVADRLRLAPSYVYQLARRGDLPTLRMGKYVRVRPEDLREWEARLGKNPLDNVRSAMVQRTRSRRGTAPPAELPRPTTRPTRQAAGRALDHPRRVGAGPNADSKGGG